MSERNGTDARRDSLVIDQATGRLIREALAEDLGAGDITTEATVGPDQRGTAQIIAKAEGIFCGAPVAERVWRLAGRGIRIDWLVAEGGRVEPGDLIAELAGPYRALLIGERVALNFVQRLSGVATLTRRLVDAAQEAADDAARKAATPGRSPLARAPLARAPAICDTRKTTPLWRKLERYAVRMGGGMNHRFGLFDMVLIKENHARSAGSLTEAIRKCRTTRRRARVAAEARDAGEVAEALAAGAGLILLDNMTPRQVKAIVRRFGPDAKGGAEFEVSGGVTLKNIRAYAATGVERISTGAVTHSAPALDLSLQIHPIDSSETKTKRRRRGPHRRGRSASARD